MGYSATISSLYGEDGELWRRGARETGSFGDGETGEDGEDGEDGEEGEDGDL